MTNLAEYRRKATWLADFLPWAALVGEGIVLTAASSARRAFAGRISIRPCRRSWWRSPDLLNNALRRLGSGWAIFVEAQRQASTRYPESRFPDAASAMVDAERKADFEEAGAHFESNYALTFVWLPPAEDAARAERVLYEGRRQAGADPRAALAAFTDRTDRVLQLIEGFMPECRWLDDAETLSFLHACVSTKRHRVRVPETPIDLGALLALRKHLDQRTF